MTIKIKKHRLKIIFQNHDFQNDPSMGETLNNVVLQLIIKMLLKKHTQFCSVGIFESFIEARICLDIIWWRRRGWGRFWGFLFFNISGSLVSFLRISFQNSLCALMASLSLLQHPSLRRDRLSHHHHCTTLSGCGCFFHLLKENLQHLQAWRYYDIYSILYTVNLLIR